MESSLARLREQLPVREDNWALLHMKYVLGFSFQQMAEALDVGVNTISSRLARAKQRLRELVISRRASLDSTGERLR